ncbi:MAG: hypothetical protein OXH77_08525 [Anaerolineaceae bacterium]|nr:hypothetical protein [Anaerolineaceae bacterium]
MSVEDIIRALPRVELFLQLEGAYSAQRLLVIAGQNGFLEDPDSLAVWQEKLDSPNPASRYELMAETSRWLDYEDDVALMVYEAGLALARQNVLYAEIHVNTLHFTEHRWHFERLLQSLNDGRRRAEVAWKIDIRWVLSIFRDQPRHADEAVRIASSKDGQAAGIVGICLGGPEGAQPPGQFERAFRTAARKGIPAAVHSNADAAFPGNLREALEQLQPQRLIGGFGIDRDPQLMDFMAQDELPLIFSMSEALALGLVNSFEDYPLKQLVDAGLKLVPACGMPSVLGATLVDEQLAVVQRCGLGLDELQQLTLNAVAASWLPEGEKADLENGVRERTQSALTAHPEEEV